MFEFLWEGNFLLPMFRCVLMGHFDCVMRAFDFHRATYFWGYSQPRNALYTGYAFLEFVFVLLKFLKGFEFKRFHFDLWSA